MGVSTVFTEGHIVTALYSSNWAAGFNRSQSVFGITVGGELSTAVNSCGVWYVTYALGFCNNVSQERRKARRNWH